MAFLIFGIFSVVYGFHRMLFTPSLALSINSIYLCKCVHVVDVSIHKMDVPLLVSEVALVYIFICIVFIHIRI
jgi:hypothetical protein